MMATNAAFISVLVWALTLPTMPNDPGGSVEMVKRACGGDPFCIQATEARHDEILDEGLERDVAPDAVAYCRDLHGSPSAALHCYARELEVRYPYAGR